MPQIIAGEEIATRSELEADIQGLSREEQLDWRRRHQAKVFQLRQQERAPTSGLVRGALGAGLNLGNTLGFGIPKVASAGVSAFAEEGLERLGVGPEIPLGDRFALAKDRGDQILGASPAGQTVGQIGAFFTPSSPVAGVSRIGFRALGGERLARAAARAATGPNAGLTQAAARQIASGMAGGAGAAIAVALPEAIVEGEDPLAAVIQAGPSGAIVGGGLGAVASAFRAVPKEATQRLMARVRRSMPDFQFTADMARDPGGFLSEFMESVGRSTAGRRDVARWLAEGVYRPIRQALHRIESGISPRTPEGNVARGAAALRALVPREGVAGSGAINRQIAETGRRAFGEAGDAPVPAEAQLRLLQAIRGFNNEARRRFGLSGPRGSEMAAVMTATRRAIRAANQRRKAGEPGLLARDVEELRQLLAPLAKFGGDAGRAGINVPNLSARDTREARRLYAIVRAAERSASPIIDDALQSIARLRRLNESLKPVAKVVDEGDLKVLQTAFGARDFGRRWQTITETLPVDRVQALRGAYLADFMEKVIIRRGPRGAEPERLPLIDRMTRELRNPSGQFNREKFDLVLGRETREAIEDVAFGTDLALQGLGRAEGSATARRLQDTEALKFLAKTMIMATEVLSNPGVAGRIAGNVLGVAGIFGFSRALIRPDGALATRLNELATGGVVLPGSLLPAVIENQGGIGGAAAGAGQVIQGAANEALRGVSPVVRGAGALLQHEEVPQ